MVKHQNFKNFHCKRANCNVKYGVVITWYRIRAFKTCRHQAGVLVHKTRRGCTADFTNVGNKKFNSTINLLMKHQSARKYPISFIDAANSGTGTSVAQ